MAQAQIDQFRLYLEDKENMVPLSSVPYFFKTGTDTCGVGVKRKLGENETSTVAFSAGRTKGKLSVAGEDTQPPVLAKKRKVKNSSKTGTDTCGVGVKRKLDENETSTVAFSAGRTKGKLSVAGEDTQPPVSSKKIKLDTTNVDFSTDGSTPITSNFNDRRSFVIKANNDRKVKHKTFLKLKRQVKKFNEGHKNNHRD
jgi:hypothetical protein